MKARYLLALAALLLVASGVQMVAHQHHARTLEKAVQAADASGQDPAAGLAAAQAYLNKHMGVSLAIFLQASYDRALQAAQAAANPQSSGEVYAAAQAACAGKADSIVQARCVQAYVSAHAPAAPNPQAVAMPTKADYTKRLSSPTWTADAAGITFLLGLVFLGTGGYLAIFRRL